MLWFSTIGEKCFYFQTNGHVRSTDFLRFFHLPSSQSQLNMISSMLVAYYFYARVLYLFWRNQCKYFPYKNVNIEIWMSIYRHASNLYITGACSTPASTFQFPFNLTLQISYFMEKFAKTFLWICPYNYIPCRAF